MKLMIEFKEDKPDVLRRMIEIAGLLEQDYNKASYKQFDYEVMKNV